MRGNLSERGEWEKIGTETIEVEVEATEGELLLLGREMTEFMANIDKLETELSDFRKEIKGKVDALKRLLRQCSEIIASGKKMIPRTLPVYLDGKSRMRVYVDETSGEIIETRGAYAQDFQRSLA